MHPSQLQNLLGIDELTRDTSAFIEATLAVIGMLGAIAVRRRTRTITPTTLLLLSISLLLDAASHYLRSVSAGDIANQSTCGVWMAAPSISESSPA